MNPNAYYLYCDVNVKITGSIIDSEFRFTSSFENEEVLINETKNLMMQYPESRWAISSAFSERIPIKLIKFVLSDRRLKFMHITSKYALKSLLNIKRLIK